jgi:hypothetical protein
MSFCLSVFLSDLCGKSLCLVFPLCAFVSFVVKVSFAIRVHPRLSAVNFLPITGANALHRRRYRADHLDLNAGIAKIATVSANSISGH